MLVDGTLQSESGGCTSETFLTLGEALVVVRFGFKAVGGLDIRVGEGVLLTALPRSGRLMLAAA